MAAAYDVLCLSHLRWDSMTQRPQHLLSRAGMDRRVFFIEEPVASTVPHLEICRRSRHGTQHGVYVCVPHVPTELTGGDVRLVLEAMLERMCREQNIRDHVLWYYSPQALAFTRHLSPRAIVYDRMDELNTAKDALPLKLRQLEAELFQRADVVFTGGHTLVDSLRSRASWDETWSKMRQAIDACVNPPVPQVVAG
jgi:UDP-galactopyranose mutase